MMNFDKPGPNMAAVIAFFEQRKPGDAPAVTAKSLGWDAFRLEMYRVTNRFPRSDVTPEEAAHVWLEALGQPVPDPTCGRGR